MPLQSFSNFHVTNYIDEHETDRKTTTLTTPTAASCRLISLYHLPGPLDTICGDGMCTGRFQHLRLDDDSMPAAVRCCPLECYAEFSRLQKLGYINSNHQPYIYSYYIYKQQKIYVYAEYIHFKSMIQYMTHLRVGYLDSTGQADVSFVELQLPRVVQNVGGAQKGETGGFINPIASMYGIFTYIYHKNQPNVDMFKTGSSSTTTYP